MNLFHTHVSRTARQYADEVLASGNLSEGRMVKAFEEALTGELGLCNPVCVNSGTSALHLALILAGVGPGDEVILPPQTFVATGMAILYCGAKPIFCDVQPDTGNICPKSAKIFYEQRLRRSLGTIGPKAIITVDWAGLPCDYGELESEDWGGGVCLVEDAAHALGAKYKGEPLGKPFPCGFTCFSFQATKHLTTGDGGAVCGSIENWETDFLKELRWFGINREPRPYDSWTWRERQFSLAKIGYKYHMNDLAAAVGLGNLETFKDRLAKRQANGAFYRKELADVPGLILTRLPADRTHAYYVFPLLVERRDNFARMMKSKGISVSIVCSRIDKQPVFGGQRDDLPGMDYFDTHQINIPCHEGLYSDDRGKIVEAIKGGW